MIPPFRRISLLSVPFVAAVLVLSACSKTLPPAATVNGEKISDSQLAGNVKLFKFLSSLSRTGCGQAVPGETPESACARFTLSNLIQETLVRQYASAHNISVADSKVTAAIDQLTTSLGGPDKLSSLLKTQGLTGGDLHGLAARLLLFKEVQTAIGSAQVTDAQLRQTYEASKTQYTQLHAEHILVKTKGEALKIEQQVTTKNFNDLATKYSIDPSAKQNAGDLGTVQASKFDQTFVQAALALKPGEISPPVHTQFGWHIIELLSATVTPFSQVRRQLLDQAAGPIFDKWLQGRLTSAQITVNPRYGRLNTTTGQVEPIRSTATGSAKPTPTSTVIPTSSVPVVPAP